MRREEFYEVYQRKFKVWYLGRTKSKHQAGWGQTTWKTALQRRTCFKDFNLPDVCWKNNAAERKQSRRFLECMEDNFLTQLVSESTREGIPLDLLFANREGL
ncbi:hypothetical protein QYF61_027019, partial [Mycteria americana]